MIDLPAFPAGKTLVMWTAKDEAGNVFRDTQVVTVSDNDIPKVKIILPKDRSFVTPLTSGKILVNGTAFDSGGIQKVQVTLQSPLTGKIDYYVDAQPDIIGNWSNWWILLDTSGHNNLVEITARVTDLSRHQNWDHVQFALVRR